MKQYESPPSNLRSLRDRLTQNAKREGLVFGRVQQHVAMLVVAQLASRSTEDSAEPLLLVKGGSSLELRRGVAESRTSRDLDTVARHDIEEVHELLAQAGEVGWSGFTAIFTAPEDAASVGRVDVTSVDRHVRIRLDGQGPSWTRLRRSAAR